MGFQRNKQEGATPTQFIHFVANCGTACLRGDTEAASRAIHDIPLYPRTRAESVKVLATKLTAIGISFRQKILGLP